jgi:hypothetical protein
MQDIQGNFSILVDINHAIDFFCYSLIKCSTRLSPFTMLRSYLVVQEILQLIHRYCSIPVFVKLIKLLLKFELSLIELSLLLNLSFLCVDIAESILQFLIWIASWLSLPGYTTSTTVSTSEGSRLASGLRSWGSSGWDQEVKVHICLFRRELNYLN